MAAKDKQYIEMVDIEYAAIQPMSENLEENLRRECTVKQETEKERLERIADMFLARPAYGKTKSELASEIKNANKVKICNSSNLDMAGDNHKGLKPTDKEYAAIHPVTEKTDDNTRKDRTVRQETEEERLKRKADMFLARPAFSKDKREIASDGENECEEVTSKQIQKEKKERVEQKKNVLKEGNESDGLKVYNSIEAFVDDSEKPGILPGCFAFIGARMKKRMERKLIKKSKTRCYEVQDTDFNGLVIDAWENDGVRHIVLN